MFSKALLIKTRNFILTLLMVHVPVVAHANNWNNGSSSSLVSSTNIRLDCETTNYGLSGYPDKWGKSWVPPRYSLVVSGGTVTLAGRNAKGRITRDTAERIEVAFDSAKDTRIDGGHLKGTYFRTNNKFMARVKFSGGYIESGPIWGVCKEVNFSPNEQAKKNNKTSDENIFEAVMGLLIADPKVDAENYSITVVEGVVTISGAAKSADEKQRVIEYATIPTLPIISVNSLVEISEPTNTNDELPLRLDKAKSTCTELGFALGTEKHGECVLKMMDN